MQNQTAPHNPFEPHLYGGVQFDHGGEITTFDDGAAKIRWRLKGNKDGPIYQGQAVFQSCQGCGKQSAGKFVKRKPKPFHEFPARSERAIVIPWLSTAAVWSELKFCLRAIDRFFTDQECPIYIIGDAPPKWLKRGERVEFIESKGYQFNNETGLYQAFQTGMQIANQVGWWNDDIYLIRETGWDDMRIALTEGDLAAAAQGFRDSGIVWQVGLGEAIEEMKLLGKGTMRFATHTPYLFEREKSQQIFRDFYLHFKGSWVTLYHNFHETPHTPSAPYKVCELPARSKTARYLNHKHDGPTARTREELVKMFPEKAAWEI